MNKKVKVEKENKPLEISVGAIVTIVLLVILLVLGVILIKNLLLSKPSFTITDTKVNCPNEYTLNLKGCNIELEKDSYGFMQFSNVTCPSWIDIQAYQSYTNFLLFAVKDINQPSGIIGSGNVEVKIVQKSCYIENYSEYSNNNSCSDDNFYAVINNNYKGAIKLDKKEVCSQEEVDENIIKNGYFRWDNEYKVGHRNVTLNWIDNPSKSFLNKWCKGNNLICVKDLSEEWLDENCECISACHISPCTYDEETNSYKYWKDGCEKYSCFDKYEIVVNS